MELGKVMWRIDGIYNADAQKVYEEMKSCPEVSAKEVLEKARDESTELHKCFEWDDRAAAEKYRLHQASNIIRFIIEKPTGENTEDGHGKRVFQISSERGVYQEKEYFVKNASESDKLLARALEELESFKRRYSSLKDQLMPVFDAIDSMI